MKQEQEERVPYSNRTTSKAAAKKAAKGSGEKRRKILELISLRPVIDEEICIALNMDGNTVRPRRDELVQDYMLIRKSGRRKTRAGCWADVWEEDPEGDRRVLAMKATWAGNMELVSFGVDEDTPEEDIVSFGTRRYKIKIGPEQIQDLGRGHIPSELASCFKELSRRMTKTQQEKRKELMHRLDQFLGNKSSKSSKSSKSEPCSYSDEEPEEEEIIDIGMFF